MGKTITVSDEAYKRLKKHKREGESFSDIINEAFPVPFKSGKDYINYYWPNAKIPKKGSRARKAR